MSLIPPGLTAADGAAPISEVVTDVLRSEYQGIIASMGEIGADDAIIAALAREGDGTGQRARFVARLARKCGASILRNALSLAEAKNFDDGPAAL